MKRASVVLAIALVAAVVPAFALAQKPKPWTKHAPTAADAATVRELTDLEQSWAAALLKRDAAVLERLLADELVDTSPTGEVATKAEDVAAVPSYNFASYVADEIRVQIYGQAAVVTGRSTQKGSFKGKDLSGVYRWTDTWVKRNGKWQCVATQGSKVAE